MKPTSLTFISLKHDLLSYVLTKHFVLPYLRDYHPWLWAQTILCCAAQVPGLYPVATPLPSVVTTKNVSQETKLPRFKRARPKRHMLTYNQYKKVNYYTLSALLCLWNLRGTAPSQHTSVRAFHSYAQVGSGSYAGWPSSKSLEAHSWESWRESKHKEGRAWRGPKTGFSLPCSVLEAPSLNFLKNTSLKVKPWKGTRGHKGPQFFPTKTKTNGPRNCLWSENPLLSNQ